jgi:hypothetical protein
MASSLIVGRGAVPQAFFLVVELDPTTVTVVRVGGGAGAGAACSSMNCPWQV